MARRRLTISALYLQDLLFDCLMATDNLDKQTQKPVRNASVLFSEHFPAMLYALVHLAIVTGDKAVEG